MLFGTLHFLGMENISFIFIIILLSNDLVIIIILSHKPVVKMSPRLLIWIRKKWLALSEWSMREEARLKDQTNDIKFNF